MNIRDVHDCSMSSGVVLRAMTSHRVVAPATTKYKYNYFKPNADFSGGKSKKVELECTRDKDSESHIYY